MSISVKGRIRSGAWLGVAGLALTVGGAAAIVASGLGPAGAAAALQLGGAAVVGVGALIAVAGGAILGAGLRRERRERDRIERELRDTDRLLRSVIIGLRQRIAVLDETGKILAGTRVVRRQAEEGAGGADDAVGTIFIPDCEALRGDPTPQARAAWTGLQAVLAGEQREFQIEYPCDGDGGVRWFLMRVCRVEGAQDEPARVVVSNEEITERVLAAAAIQESEERFRSLVSSADDLIYALDRDRRYLGIYGCWLEREGVDPAKWIGHTPTEILGRGGGEVHEGPHRRALEGEHVIYEWVWRGALGERHIQSSISPLRDQNGEIQGIVGVGRDITERVRSEREVRRRDSILQAVGFASERFLRENEWEGAIRAVLHRLGEGAGASRAFVITARRDEGGQPRARLRYEWTAPGIGSLREVTGIDGTLLDAPAIARWVDRLGRGEVVHGSRNDFADAERAILESSGARSMLLAPIFVGNELVGCLGFDDCRCDRSWSVAEIDAIRLAAETLGAAMDRKRVEKALREREAELQQAQKMEAVGRLAGGIAHDFNNLLTAIQGRTDLLLEEVGDASPYTADLAEIRAAAGRAATLTRQLLAFSRKQVLQPKVLNLNEVVREVESMLRRMIGEDIVFVTRLAPDLGAVRADPTHIEQVLMNLLINARDAMPEGGAITLTTANVEVERRQEHAGGTIEPGPYVLLEVADTGCGVPRELHERIFEPFFTTKEPGKGTGLGLSMVWGIVKQSGGHVLLESEEGKGATFRILLPRDRSRVRTPARVAQPKRSVARGTETILLVEDEPSVRALVRRVLERQGYTILEATNGAEAVQLAQTHAGPIDLLLTDVVMPGMNGPKAVEQLVPHHPGLRVLLMSGYTDQEVLRAGTLPVRAAFLSKPFSPDVLERKVREILDADPEAPTADHFFG
jgi:PAS domain S-box-containing protein